MTRTSSNPVYLCSELVKVRYTGDPSYAATVAANLEEISAHGASLSSERPLRTGAGIEIRCEHHTLRGHVSSWTCDELGYTTWVEFDADSQWSPELFRPRHMLDPRTLQRPLHYAA